MVAAAAATGRTRLWSTVGCGNAASLRVLDKLGFHQDRVDEHGAFIWLTRQLP